MRRFLPVVAAIAACLSARAAQAQEAAPQAAGPCRDAPCRVTYDWGSGATAATYGSDRRYGAAVDLEQLFKEVLQGNGLRIVESGDGATLITVRIKMARAMCDQMAGTSTDRSCQTVDELMIQFSSPDPAVKPPGGMRVANRCGAGDTKMTVAQMARYAGDYVTYQLAVDKKAAKRAVARC